MEFYSIGKFAKMIGKTTQTLRNWHADGLLIPAHITDGGTRYYSNKQLESYTGIKTDKERKIIGYCRVSSSKQKDDLMRQKDNICSYMIANGYSFEVITDIGSGINYNNEGLLKLIDMITNGEVDRIVVLYKDRLLRFGFELIENICKKYNTAIEIIDNTEKTEEQELVEDMIQIITVFSCRLHGKRADKAKKMISEMIVNDNIEES